MTIELTYRWAKPIAYRTVDPGHTVVNLPVYFTRASQGWLMATAYWSRKGLGICNGPGLGSEWKTCV